MNLYAISDDAKAQIQATFGTNPKQIEKDVETVQEWLKKQPHLPQKLPYDNFIEQVLINNKFSVTRTKDKIEKYFTIRGFNREIYAALNEKPLLLPSQNPLAMIPMPRLGPKNERIIVIFARTSNGSFYESWQYIQALLAGVEFGLRYNYSDGALSILDMKNMGFDFLKSIDLTQWTKVVALLMNAFSSRIAAIEVIHANSCVNFLIKAMKTAVKPKILDRIRFHKDFASLQASLPPKYLPKEYGGAAESIRDLEGDFDKYFEKHREFFATIGHYVSDESLRIKEVKSDFSGIEGTFRRLDID